MKKLFFLATMLAFVCNAAAQLPSVSLKDLSGKTVNTAELKNDGKPFIIDFFATWCKPCNRELDAIAEVYEDWQEETGVKIFAVTQGYLGTMDIRVRRNAYGRQLGSFHTTGTIEGIGTDVPMTFIRAPYIEEVLSADCQPIAQVDGHIVAARQGNQIATAFHPELDDDTRLHQLLISLQ